MQKDMTSSHSEREIFDGCVDLMNDMVEFFYQYLTEYLDIDVEDIPEDERFGINYQVTEIVERLFLRHTSHSGGTSQAMKCRELGLDPYKTMHFDFDELMGKDQDEQEE